MFLKKSEKVFSSTHSQIKTSDSILKINPETTNTFENKLSKISKIPTQKDLIEENLIFDYKYAIQ